MRTIDFVRHPIRVFAMLFAASHAAPDVSYTQEQAHAVMQEHRACTARVCRRKSAAYWTLVLAGRITPRPEFHAANPGPRLRRVG
jgi:hypothetical protein